MQSFAIAYWCMLIVCLLPYLAVFIAKSSKRYDNSDPRGWLATQEGYRKRAHAAHLNAFEAMAPFLAAIIINVLVGSSAMTVNLWAIFFVSMRLLHLVFYVGNNAILRSLVFTGGLVAVVALFVLALSNVK